MLIKTEAGPGAVVSALLGLFLLLCPGIAAGLLGEILAAGLILAGLISLLAYSRTGKISHTGRNRSGAGVFGIVALVIGIWMLSRPYKLAELIPVVLGIIVLWHGIRELKIVSAARKQGDPRWWISFCLGAASIVFGLICIGNAFSMTKLALRVVGAILLYDGISGMLIIRKTEPYRKTDPVDSDFHEI